MAFAAVARDDLHHHIWNAASRAELAIGINHLCLTWLPSCYQRPLAHSHAPLSVSTAASRRLLFPVLQGCRLTATLSRLPQRLMSSSRSQVSDSCECVMRI